MEALVPSLIVVTWFVLIFDVFMYLQYIKIANSKTRIRIASAMLGFVFGFVIAIHVMYFKEVLHLW